jgi:hypothetical protein
VAKAGDSLKLSSSVEVLHSLSHDDPRWLLELLSTSIPKLNVTGRWIVFKRIEEMTGIEYFHLFNFSDLNLLSVLGIKFHDRIRSKFLASGPPLPMGSDIFDEVDLDRFSVKVKHQPFVYIIQGLLFFSKAKLELSRSSVDLVSLFHRAIHLFELSLQSDPTNFISLIHCAQSYFYLLRSHYKDASVSGDPNEDESFARGENYYIRAIQAMPKNEITYLLYARYLEETGRFERAEKVHLQGLDINPFSVPNLRRYADLLKRMEEFDMAEKFEKRSYLIEAAAGVLFSDVSASQKYLASFLN